MTPRRTLLAATAALALLPAAVWAQDAAQEAPIPVVATFSVLGDMVKEVGGDRVAVTTLVGPGGDAHVYQPSPADARAVADARVVFVNGLGFEGWLDRLTEAAEYAGPVVVASTGVEPREMEGEEDGEEHAESEGAGHEEHDHKGTDPHAWQSLANARLYVENIEAGLASADPDGAEAYKANADAYLAQIDAVEMEVKAALAALPPERRRIVTTHDAFGYFAAAYGLGILAPQGVSTEAEASARDVATLITQIREEHIPAVFIENVTDPRLLQQITRETGAAIGGTLYTDALSPPDGPAPTYLDMMRHNVATLTQALGS